MDCLPVRPLIKYNTGDGAWMIAQKADQRKRFKAIICTLNATDNNNNANTNQKYNEYTKSELNHIFTKEIILENCKTVDPNKIAVINVNFKDLNPSDEEFYEFSSVYKIDAANNHLNLDVFITFQSLVELNLSSNDLHDININPQDFENLEILDLSFNNLNGEDILMLGLLKKLKLLSLIGNNLKKLPPDMGQVFIDGDGKSYPRFGQLEELNLEHNHLNSDTIFASLGGLQKLTILKLAYNNIESIPLLKYIKVANENKNNFRNKFDIDDDEEEDYENFNSFYKNNNMEIRIPSTLHEVEEEMTSRTINEDMDRKHSIEDDDNLNIQKEKNSPLTEIEFDNNNKEMDNNNEYGGEKVTSDSFSINKDKTNLIHENDLIEKDEELENVAIISKEAFDIINNGDKELVGKNEELENVERIGEEAYDILNNGDKELVETDEELEYVADILNNKSLSNIIDQEKELVNKNEELFEVNKFINESADIIYTENIEMDLNNDNQEYNNHDEESLKDNEEVTKDEINGDDSILIQNNDVQIENIIEDNIEQKNNIQNLIDTVMEDEERENERSENSIEQLVESQSNSVFNPDYNEVKNDTLIKNHLKDTNEKNYETNQIIEDQMVVTNNDLDLLSQTIEDFNIHNDSAGENITIIIDRQHSRMNEEDNNIDFEEEKPSEFIVQDEAIHNEVDLYENIFDINETETEILKEHSVKEKDENNDYKYPQSSNNFNNKDYSAFSISVVNNFMNFSSTTEIIRQISMSSFDNDMPKPFSVLKYLDLSYNKVKHEGALIPIIAWLQLKKISIHNNPISTCKSQKSSFIKALLEKTFQITVDWLPPLSKEKPHPIINKSKLRIIDTIVHTPIKGNKTNIFITEPINEEPKKISLPKLMPLPNIINESKVLNSKSTLENQLMILEDKSLEEINDENYDKQTISFVGRNKSLLLRALQHSLEHPITYFERNVDLFVRTRQLQPKHTNIQTRTKNKVNKREVISDVLRQQNSRNYETEISLDQVTSANYYKDDRTKLKESKVANKCLQNMQKKYNQVRLESLKKEF